MVHEGTVGRWSVRCDHISDVASAHWKLEQHQGCGFVKFLKHSCAVSAVRNLHRSLFRGREITVRFARTRLRKPSEMRAKKLARSPSLSGSDLRLSEDESRQQPPPAEGGRASPAGRDNHTRDHPGGVEVSPADESSVVRVELGDAWRGRACGGCGKVVHVWNDHHGCTEELSQDVIRRLRIAMIPI